MKKYIENSKNYFVSDEGNIYRGSNKLKLNNSKYKQVVIFNLDGTQSRWYVHRLVATYFIPNKLNKPQVNHIDGDKYNNNITNLEWVTNQENARHATEFLKRNVGESNHLNIYTEAQIKLVCKLLQERRRQVDIENITHVPRGSIRSIKNRQQWTHISKDYTFYKDRRGISDSTANWVCEMLSEGKRHKEILRLSTCSNLKVGTIDSILHGNAYRDISSKYIF